MNTLSGQPAPDDGDLHFTRVFAAPRGLVFQCMTQPQHLTHFWAPVGSSAPVEHIRIDPRPVGSSRPSSSARLTAAPTPRTRSSSKSKSPTDWCGAKTTPA